jgi:hypothetical protein
MLSRATTAAFLVLVATACPGVAQPKRDYLARGEEYSTDAFARKRWGAVREICERAFRQDVVLRLVCLPAFHPEYACGLARHRTQCRAFIAGPSSNLAVALSQGSRPDGTKVDDWHKLKRRGYERPISTSLAARIATLWRRVLRDQQNYGKDPNIYIDTDRFCFYLRFTPGEQITAHMQAWGPHVWQLLKVDGALAAYAEGIIGERELSQEVATAERKLGI